MSRRWLTRRRGAPVETPTVAVDVDGLRALRVAHATNAAQRHTIAALHRELAEDRQLLVELRHTFPGTTPLGRRIDERLAVLDRLARKRAG